MILISRFILFDFLKKLPKKIYIYIGVYFSSTIFWKNNLYFLLSRISKKTYSNFGNFKNHVNYFYKFVSWVYYHNKLGNKIFEYKYFS